MEPEKYDVEASFNALIESLVEEQMVHFNPNVESVETFRKRHQQEILNNLIKNQEMVAEGFFLIFSTGEFSEEEMQAIEAQTDQIDWGSEETSELLLSSAPLGMIIGLADEFYTKADNVGKKLMAEGKFEEAKKVYTCLIQLNPLEKHFLVGLGNVYFKNGEFQEASYFFGLATELASKEDIYVILLLIVDCLLCMQNFEGAEQLIEVIINETKEQEIYAEEYASALENKEFLKELLA